MLDRLRHLIPERTGDNDKDIDAIIKALHELCQKSIRQNALVSNIDVQGDLYVAGKTTLSGSAALKSALQVAGTTTLSGAVALSTSLFVAGTTTLSGTAVLSTNLQVGGTSTLSGNAALLSNLSVAGTTTLSGNAALLANLSVAGTTTLSGAATLKTTLKVEGQTTLSATAALQGLLDLQSGQIKFPATQSSSSDANTLDDYEEGTWTPSIAGDGTAGTQTYSTRVARYTKFGRLVHIECAVIMATKDAATAGNMILSGLPFAQGFGGGGYAMANWQSINLDVGGFRYTLGFLPSNTNTFLFFTQSGDNVAAGLLAPTDFTATSGVFFAGTYSV